MNKKTRPTLAEETQESFDRNSRAASSWECTGLAPFGVGEDSQSESYSDLYDIHPPQPQNKKR